jgi:hypothetical protein
MRLHDRARAAAASVFRAARDQHPQLRWDHIQPLAHILADPRHRHLRRRFVKLAHNTKSPIAEAAVR